MKVFPWCAAVGSKTIASSKIEKEASESEDLVRRRARDFSLRCLSEYKVTFSLPSKSWNMGLAEEMVLIKRRQWRRMDKIVTMVTIIS